MDKLEESKILTDGNLTLKECLALPKTKQYYYHIFDKENNKVGNCGLRLEDTFDNYFLGNMEYEIFEDFRGNGYAEEASRLLGKLALDLGATTIRVTARPSNKASIRTIENLGANFIEVVKVPRNLLLHKDSPYVSVYEWNIKEGVKSNDRH